MLSGRETIQTFEAVVMALVLHLKLGKASYVTNQSSCATIYLGLHRNHLSSEFLKVFKDRQACSAGFHRNLSLWIKNQPLL